MAKPLQDALIAAGDAMFALAESHVAVAAERMRDYMDVGPAIEHLQIAMELRERGSEFAKQADRS